MNNKYKVFILFVLFSSMGSAIACGNHALISTTKDNGKKIGLFISPEQIKKTPTWSPQNGEPPLSVSKAFTILKKWSKEYYARYDDVAIHEISLKKYHCLNISDHWFYSFELAPIIEGNQLRFSGNWAAVLFDGTVIGTKEY